MRVHSHLEWWFYLSGLATSAILLCAVGWIQHATLGRSSPWESTGAAVLFTLWLAVVVRRDWERVRRILKGAIGEREVGEILDDLRAKGYLAVHGVPISAVEDGHAVGDIDHVLIGPAGVFAIETKRLSRNSKDLHPRIAYDGQKVTIDGRLPDRDPVVQVRRGAFEVSRIVKQKTGREIWVNAIVVYPGCWISSTHHSNGEVGVMNPKQLFSWLRRHEEAARAKHSLLSEDDVDLIHHVLLEVQPESL